MWGALFGGLASAAGSIGSSLINANSTAGANKYNIKLWREQAAYNTPANQMARFREAGLNPNLIYSQGNPGNISSAPTVQPKQYNFDFAQAIDKMAVFKQMKNLDEQNKNLQAQNDNLHAQTSKIKADTKRADIQAEVDKLQLDYFKKYGRFPNQSVPSTVTQAVQDLTGLSTYSLEAGRKFVLDKIFKPTSDAIIKKRMDNIEKARQGKYEKPFFLKSRF